MKRHCLIGLLLLLAMAACTRPSDGSVETRHGTSLPIVVSPELSSVDSLMWQRPDSALARLLPYFDTCCRDVSRNVSTSAEHNWHYANILLAELLYKNDYAQTNRAELLQAVDYFDSLVDAHGADTHGADTRGVSLRRHNRRDASHASATMPQSIAFLDARAHYINGVGYYENDSVVQACAEYLKALEIMEGYFEEKELLGHKAQFIALTYTRLSMLYSDMYLHEQAIYFAQLSLASNQKTDVPQWHIARMLCEIGVQYDMLERLDSADYYYKNAAVVLNDTNSLLYRDILTRQIVLSYKRKGIEKNTLFQLHFLLSQANNEAESLLRCLTIGGIFYQEKQMDSAWYYLNRVYNNTKSIASKKQAAEWLAEICKTQGKDTETFEYASFLVPFANQEENQSEVKSQLTELYNAYWQAYLASQHRKTAKKNMTLGLVIVGGLMVGILAYVLLYHKNKRRKQLLEKQLIEEQLSHDMKQKALAGRLKQSNQKLHETLKWIEDRKARLETVGSNTSCDTFDERYEAFRRSPICLEILDKVEHLHANNQVVIKTNSDITEYKAFAMTLLQTAQLTKAVESFFPNLYTALKSQYDALDRKEWLHCCLYLLQLDKMSICVLLQEPYYTCRRYILKLEEVFDCRQGLSAFIMEQIKAY